MTMVPLHKMLVHVRVMGALAGLLCSCSCSHTASQSEGSSLGHTPGDNAGRSDVPEGTVNRHEPGRASAAPPPEPAGSSTGKKAPEEDTHAERLILDLAGEHTRAERREGDTLIVDFGDAASHKYDFGGWLSGVQGTRTLGDATATIARGKVLRLALPSAQPGAATLVLRLRTFSQSALTAYLNGQRLGDRKLSGDDFELVRFELPTEHLEVGENELLLRTTRSGPVPGGGRSGMALDWLRVGPAGEQAEDRLQQSPPPRSRTTDGLWIPAGHRLDHTLQIRADMRLRGVLEPGRAGQKARVSIRAHTDGHAPRTLLETRIAEEAQAFDLDLNGLAGQLVKLELAADGADVQIDRPRIVTLVSGERPTALPPLKHVVIILIDTLRADKLEPYNTKTRVRTPGLDTFLEGAAVLTNARSQENWTKPSVATLLSSLMPWEHKATKGDSRVPRSVQLLPELLRKRGYYTGSFIANGYVSDKFGFKQGWHTYRNYIREGRRAKAQYVAADVLDWLDRRPEGKPFFLYMHTIDPHVPYKPPQHFLSMYDGDRSYGGPVDFRASSTLLEKIKLGSIKLRKRDKQRLEALYDAEISYHDVHFAAVLEGLEKRGLADDTIVVVTADHGEEFWDHGSVGHGHSVYDELLHVPLIVRIPGITHGAMRIDDAVGLVDVMPTILEALGEELPPEMSGRSFLDQLKGGGTRGPRTAVAGFMNGWRTLSVGDLKLIQRNLKEFRLYDTAKDPGEQENLADTRPIAARYARGLLGLTLAESTLRGTSHRGRRRHVREKVHIDERTAEQLKALGYTGD